MASTYNSDPPLLDTYQAVVLAFSEFLIVAIHTILYERDIYPQTSFLSARKYNYPVKQSRHPKVCKWIQDAVAAVEVEMLKSTLSTTSLLIHSPPPLSQPLERYLFSTTSFPLIPTSEILTPFSPTPDITTSTPPATTKIPTNNNPPLDTTPLPPNQLPPSTSSLPQQFRATISRLSNLSSTLSPLPAECTFTLAIELRDTAPAPIRNPQPWIVAEPGLQRVPGEEGAGKEGGEEGKDGDGGEEEGGKRKFGRDLGGAKTTPVRALEAGAFAMEVWIEEGRGKFE